MSYSTINKHTDHFNTKLYTGNGTDDRSITGVGFQPDFSWVKRRDSTGSHRLKDSVRGATKTLISNSTGAESTEANVFQAFESDGFQLGSDSVLNASGGTYASWNWLGGGTASSNTDGSITSSVSANTTNGFSIVSYTGTAANATVGHGLGSAPNVIFFKSRGNASTNWYVYHSSLGHGTRITLNSTGASASDTEYMNNTAPTNSVFSLGANGTTNPSTTQIAYCFAEKAGYSKFGSYTGNGSTDGTFVYTGFKPAFTILKRTDAVGGWLILDNKRDTFNVAGKLLYAYDNSQEQDIRTSHSPLDFLSNGMKMRSSNLTGTTSLNISGATYIYMAFGQSLVGSNNVPCTAR